MKFDKMDLCLHTIETVVKHFQKEIEAYPHYEQFDMPIINLGVGTMDSDRYAELETVDAFHEYTVVLNKDWMTEVTSEDHGFLIGIVAHECVHAFQMTRDGWESFPEHDGGYWFDPYEIEARGLERAFEHLVLKNLKKQKKKSS